MKLSYWRLFCSKPTTKSHTGPEVPFSGFILPADVFEINESYEANSAAPRLNYVPNRSKLNDVLTHPSN